jgi:AraC-like DNA-binding protein
MYRERASTLPHVTAWWSVTEPGDGPKRILPDGCLDIIWGAGRVFVAGPDTTAQVAAASPGSRSFALRFGSGSGPVVLGVPASELVDRQVPLEELWPAADVRRLAEAADPLAALEEAAAARWREPDRAMVALARAARAGVPVGVFADRAGLSARQLQRRSNTAFGYGPKTLHRVFRLQRAVALARDGHPFADVAADAGYADQAHLARETRALAGVPLGTLIDPPAPGSAALSSAALSSAALSSAALSSAALSSAV